MPSGLLHCVECISLNGECSNKLKCCSTIPMTTADAVRKTSHRSLAEHVAPAPIGRLPKTEHHRQFWPRKGDNHPALGVGRQRVSPTTMAPLTVATNRHSSQRRLPEASRRRARITVAMRPASRPSQLPITIVVSITSNVAH
jgi:hypothetical protein